MATLPTKAGAVTLTDFAKSIDPDGRLAAVIELLNQNNQCLQDILWKEGNLPTGHRTTVRTGLPSGRRHTRIVASQLPVASSWPDGWMARHAIALWCPLRTAWHRTEPPNGGGSARQSPASRARSRKPVRSSGSSGDQPILIN